VALTQVDVLVIPKSVLDDLVRADHRLARELGRQLEQRRQAITQALAEEPADRMGARLRR
jgi:CRP-like cAMP-binding protein